MQASGGANVVFSMPNPGVTNSEQAFANAHAQLLKHTDYQFSLPGFQAPKPPDWLVALGRLLSHNWPSIKWMIWIVGTALLLAAAITLVRKYAPLLPGLLRRRPRAEQPAESQWRPTQAAARELLHESDALAAEGRYGDAVHLLLLRSIEDINAWRPRLVRRDFTSREIGMLQALPSAARTIFRAIAQLVERARFAGGAIDAEDFAWCRKAYERFAFADAWQGQP